MKKQKIYFDWLHAFLITLLVLTTAIHGHAMHKQQKHVQKCERCEKLEYAIIQVLAVIENDQTDYVLDVLSETDEYVNLYELLNEDCRIPDSTYAKMRKVFPDLPKEQ